MRERTLEFEKIFRALGDKHRLFILELLMEREQNAGELLERVSVVQSTLSHHMKALCESGLVVARKEGKWTYYTVATEVVEEAREFLKCYLEEKPSGAPAEEVSAAAPSAEHLPDKGAEEEEVSAAVPSEEHLSDKKAEEEEVSAVVSAAAPAGEAIWDEEAAREEIPIAEEPRPVLYANMKGGKKKKEEKGKKDSDKKKSGGKKKETGKKEKKPEKRLKKEERKKWQKQKK